MWKELNFLYCRGAVKTICRCKPVIIFEFGIGAADHYGVKPEAVYDFITSDCGLSVSTLKGFLKEKEHLSREKFCSLYLDRVEYYFIAYKKCYPYGIIYYHSILS